MSRVRAREGLYRFVRPGGWISISEQPVFQHLRAALSDLKATSEEAALSNLLTRRVVNEVVKEVQKYSKTS